jgi:N-acetylmuramoyl-L-alanine amidase
MAPSRKSDPGARFDWRRLALAGLSVWPNGRGQGDFYDDLATFGYAPADPDVMLAAFRLRFRSHAFGPLSQDDIDVAASLAALYPVDQSIGSV